MALKTYLDYAEEDYNFMKYTYGHNYTVNSMGAICQSICERYMKHIIDFYYPAETKTDLQMCTKTLRTHDLSKLIDFLKQNMDITYSEKCSETMMSINGYYISTRYPGDIAVELSSDEFEVCIKAIELCRTETLEICQNLELQKTMSDDICEPDEDEPEIKGPKM